MATRGLPVRRDAACRRPRRSLLPAVPRRLASADESAADGGEVGLAVGGEVYELAVEDDAMWPERVREVSQLSKVRRAVAAGTRAERPAGLADAQLSPKAVPSDLQRPAVIQSSGKAAAQEHRLAEPRERLPRRVHPCHASEATGPLWRRDLRA